MRALIRLQNRLLACLTRHSFTQLNVMLHWLTKGMLSSETVLVQSQKISKKQSRWDRPENTHVLPDPCEVDNDLIKETGANPCTLN